MLFPAILAFCSIGVFSVENNIFDLFTVTFFGLLGYVLVKTDCEPAPLLLGFVLGPMLEEHLRRAMMVARGDPVLLMTRPIAGGLLIISVIVLLIVILPAVSRRRELVFHDK
jgi:TctA family transporter